MVWTGKWAENWILIKWWEPLEKLCKVNTIIFDKTWTITEWKPVVTDIVGVNGYDEDEILPLAVALEAKSEHPLAEAIVNYGKAQKLTKLGTVNKFQAVPGKGVQWEIGGKKYYLGTKALLADKNITIENLKEMEQLESEWKTVMLLANDTEMLGMVAVADTVKASSAGAIARLKKAWLIIYMITGDNERTAHAIARQVWIDHVMAQVLPQHKASKVKELQDQWYIVAMVGDGINDSPALTQADIGIAMGSGADVAMESGGVVIMKNDLNDVLHAIQLSKETMGKIKQNMFFALFYNTLWIPIAAGVLASWGLTLKPEFAGLAMAMSSVSVVLNSLLLKFFHPRKKNWISLFAPVIMTIVFLTFFWNFAKLGGGQDVSSLRIPAELKTEINNFLIDNPNKIWFTAIENAVSNARDNVAIPWDDYRVLRKPKITLKANISWIPKLFIGNDNSVDGVKIIEWTGIMNSDGAQMLIGYKEAAMMRREWLFKKPWDSLSNFFGLDKVKIVWILAPTNTLLDDVHIMNNRGFAWLQIKESLLLVETAFDAPELYYFYTQDTIPSKMKNVINSKKPIYTIDDKSYAAIYLGYDVAQEMKNAKEFSKLFDIIEEDGTEFIIAWLPKKTFTLLDMMHFIPRKSN